MRILILEYAAASGIKDTSICAEGYAMLNGLLEDFKHKNADYLIAENSHFKSNHCNGVEVKEDLIRWLNQNINAYDACILIAPEENSILYELTRLIEDNDVQVIGSNSHAVGICADKFEMYNALKDKVNIIKTEKVFFNRIQDYKPYFNCKKVIKPADGVSCSDVSITSSWDQFKLNAGSINSDLPYFVAQDFVGGTSASVSLLSDGKKAIPLSLNLQNNIIQENQIYYNGGTVPFHHKKAFEAKEIAKKAVESIDGLKGYVGVDLIIDNSVYIVEINSRITTPYIALKNILNFNLGEAIIDSVYGIFPSNIELNGKISFYKKGNEIKIERVNHI